jgi:hypothetical protein
LQNFAREPTPSEWERVRINASRVRRLIALIPDPYTGYGRKRLTDLYVSDLAARRLFEQFPPTTLFPNLHTFDSNALLENTLLEANGTLKEIQTRPDLSLIRKFMSPGLETFMLDISAHSPSHEVEEFLGALPIEAPGLRQLSISMDEGRMAFVVLPNFGKLPKLFSLTIRKVDVGLTRQTITNMQQAWCLNTLELSLHGTSYDSGVMALELNSLERLVLSGDVLQQCTHFIRQITTRQLSDVEIEYRQRASPIEITVLFKSLSKSCQNHEALKKIYVLDAEYVQHAEPVIPLPSEVFRPLLKFTGLLSVVIENIGNFYLDNSFINDISNAWAGIQELRFASHRPAGRDVTFNAMMSLATKCQSLKNLNLTCDASQPVIPEDEDGTEILWPVQTALRKLHFGYSYVPQVACIPYILSKVFPTLRLNRLNWYTYVGVPHPLTLMNPHALPEITKQLFELRTLAGKEIYDERHDSDSDWEIWEEDEEEWEERERVPWVDSEESDG